MEEKVKGARKIQHWQIISFYLIIYDAFVVMASHFVALWLRFDCKVSAIPENYLSGFHKLIPFYVVFAIIALSYMKLYRSLWRFASFTELYHMIIATMMSFVFNILLTVFMKIRMPISFYIFGIFVQFILTIGIRFFYRFILLIRGRVNSVRNSDKNVMIVGGGLAGQMIIKDIISAKQLNEKACCIIDDNPNKWGRYIDSVPIVGGRESIIENVEKYSIDKIYVCIPSAKKSEVADILNICKETSCEVLNLPGMYQFAQNEVTVANMKEVSVEDLLGREPIVVNLDEIFSYLQDKTIMVTGGGGSIGSELCRQIAAHDPKCLIIFDIYENNAYDIQMELKRKYPNLNLHVIIGSVRDMGKLWSVFEKYRPDVVYHAAAHKHVPLMEDSPCESIKNNVMGTYKTAFCALTHGCERFILISTDKAVNPTNIMGASKRMCEMIIQSIDKKIRENKAKELKLIATPFIKDTIGESDLDEMLENAKTRFVAVRFGNVLGSNGSVIPLFKKQIAEGGPVTVTHPDIVRYFMTIPEAVSLVLQAGFYAEGGHIFVLDMGESVKIDTLARNLIKLSGHKPDVDIKVEYTGLRPGEKLFEEKLMSEEGLTKTPNELIYIAKPIEFDEDRFMEGIERLDAVAYKNLETIKDYVKSFVITYHPDNDQV